jgi:hypothetical protein
MEMDELKGLVSQLVETTRVPHLTHIPARFQILSKVGINLKSEQAEKLKLREILIRQRDYLLLISSYLNFNGASELTDFEKVVQDYDSVLSNLKQGVIQRLRVLNTCNSRLDSVRLGMSAILNRLDNQKNHHITDVDHLLKYLPSFQNKIEKLMHDIHHLDKALEPEGERRGSISITMKPMPIPERFQRVHSGVTNEEESEGLN